jgi:hypothetical protein
VEKLIGEVASACPGGLIDDVVSDKLSTMMIEDFIAHISS